MREAPSLVLIDDLLEAGAKVQAYDPVAINEAKHLLDGKIVYAEDGPSAAKDADALVLVTEWPEFRLPNWDEIKQKMRGNAVFDGRNIYHAKEMEQWGFDYYCIGVCR